MAWGLFPLRVMERRRGREDRIAQSDCGSIRYAVCYSKEIGEEYYDPYDNWVFGYYRPVCRPYGY